MLSGQNLSGKRSETGSYCICVSDGVYWIKKRPADEKDFYLSADAGFFGRCLFPGAGYGTATTFRDFYAHITQKSGDYLIVEGIPENDVNHRWRFRFSLEDAKLTWGNTRITPVDLEVGDLIAVIYTGAVREISPAMIENVLEIQLLDHER